MGLRVVSCPGRLEELHHQAHRRVPGLRHRRLPPPLADPEVLPDVQWRPPGPGRRSWWPGQPDVAVTCNRGVPVHALALATSSSIPLRVPRPRFGQKKPPLRDFISSCRIAMVLCALGTLAAGPLASRSAAPRRPDRKPCADAVSLGLGQPGGGIHRPRAACRLSSRRRRRSSRSIRCVQTAEHSKHGPGQAVDIGELDAGYWQIVNGPRFGLCQIYADEPCLFQPAAAAAGLYPPLLASAAG
jgi:hypothetical protein